MSLEPRIKVLSVVGARPNFMKIAPIARAIENYNSTHHHRYIEHIILHTGQHYDPLMSDIFFDELELPRPDINLEVGTSSHAEQTAKIMERFEPVLLSEQPDILIVVGDVNSTLACALVASKIRYNGEKSVSRPIIAHVEAGLRSFDRDMPEEINRILTDALSDLLFITEEDAIKNLAREGISSDKIHFVGNVMIDSLLRHREKARQFDTVSSIGLQKEKDRVVDYGVVTLHRPSNVDEPIILGSLVQCMKTIASRLPLIFPLHPRTRNNLERFGFYSDLCQSGSIFLVEPLGYLEFLSLVLSARLVLTDSGGIQEETSFLRIPCITLRNNTERPVTIHLGTNYLVGTDTQKIVETAFSVLDGKGKEAITPPFWDGNAGQRIVDTLLNYLDQCSHHDQASR